MYHKSIMQVIFPASYDTTSEWLRGVIDVAEDSLFQCQQQLLSTLDDDARFKRLASGCVVSRELISILLNAMIKLYTYI